MFNFLKKKLFKVEKGIEEALGAQIEAELAKEREKARAPGAATAVPRPATVSPPVPETQPPPQAPPAPPKVAPEVPSAPAGPTPAPAPGTPPSAPTGYREVKRQAVIEEAARKKETIEERLERELSSAVQQQKAVEKVVTTTEDRIVLPADKLEEILLDLEMALLESDVAGSVVDAIKASVKEQLSVTGVSRKDPGAVVKKVLQTAIANVLSVGRLDFDAFIQQRLKEKRPVVVMFVGVNGTGKTTTIAKIAHRLQQRRVSCVMAAGDTFRAGAIEQLSLHGDRLGVKVIKHSAGSDPAAVAYDAIEHAKSRNKEVVLLDTAGRMQTNTNLMAEMAKIRRVARPDLTIFVGDSLAGNDAVQQAREFNKVVGIDGIVLTKVDADAKGGAALSVAHTIGKPLLFIGVGQGYEDQLPFDPKWMVDRLFAEGTGLEETAEA